MVGIHPVILSGGEGQRLWPASGPASPKPFLVFSGEHSMIQQTVRRVADRAVYAPPLVVTSAAHHGRLAAQLEAVGVRPAGVVREPAGRGTAAACIIAALVAERGTPDAVLLVLPADHAIGSPAAFHAAVAIGARQARAGRLVTFGIPPAGPETGYGYIRTGARLDGGEDVRLVDGFTEKPDAATARRWIARGGHVWNSGMFMWRARRLLEEARLHCPDILEAMTAALRAAAPTSADDGAEQVAPAPAAFLACRAASVDTAIMEKTSGAVVVCADMGWRDLGAWGALWETARKDAHGNVVRGDVLLHGAHGCYGFSGGRTVALVGVRDLVVVETDDAVLVVSRAASQDVKDIADEMRRRAAAPPGADADA